MKHINIEQNKTNFISTLDKYKLCEPSLIEMLEPMGLFECPASTMTSLHNACPGGLVDHLLRVAKYAINHDKANEPELKCGNESLLRVALLHGIGKVGTYVDNPSDWHRKNLGQMYKFKEDVVSMTVGERSIYYLIKSGNAGMLIEAEYQAILNFGKDLSDDQAAKWHSEPLTVALRQAVEWAIMKEKILAKNG